MIRIFLLYLKRNRIFKLFTQFNFRRLQMKYIFSNLLIQYLCIDFLFKTRHMLFCRLRMINWSFQKGLIRLRVI
ncbi:hypothetical protein D3C81_2215180 [compost metagenome]